MASTSQFHRWQVSIVTIRSVVSIFKGVTLPRVAGLCGVLCPALVLTSIWLAISYAPWFSWTENSFSDLAGMAGETPTWAARGTASIIFNSSLVIEAILAFLLAIGLRKSPQLGRGMGSMGTVLFISSSYSLFAMGIFPRTMGTIHEVFSVFFFVLAPASMIVIGAATFKASNRILGCVTVIVGIIGLSPSFIPWPWKGEAIPDMISGLAIITFATIFGIKLLKRTINPTGAHAALK